MTSGLAISETAIVDLRDYTGTGWDINFDLSSNDNDVDQALLVVTKTEGFGQHKVAKNST